MVYITESGYIFRRHLMAKADAQSEWAIKAKNILKAELKRKGVSYRDLSEKLSEMGTPLTEQGVNNKISRGGFSAAFFIQCLEAIEVTDMRL